MDDQEFDEQSNVGSKKIVCLLCRQRKVRCDRRQPSCTYCIKNSVQCKYNIPRKKPGLRAGYVSELEQRLARLEQEVQGLKAQSLPPFAANVDHMSDVGSEHHSSGSISTRRSACRSPRDFNPLAPAILNELCTVWFDKYHAWFPILHRSTLFAVLQGQEDLANSSSYFIFKAIVAVTIPHWYNSDSLSSDARQQLSSQLRSQVILQGMSQLSLQSLQALLILSILDYGAGNVSEFWNLIALCKRMGTQLGLYDLVANQCDNFNQVSSRPPRMLPLPSTLVDQEERVRAYWMIEVLDGSSTIGAAWNLGLSRPDDRGCLPCSDQVWAFPEAVIDIWSFGEFEFPSSFTLYVKLVTKELWHVHMFLQQPFDARSATERVRWHAECKAVDDRLIKWREEFVALGYPSPGSGTAAGQQLNYDPNIVMAQCALDTATIALYQRLALPPGGLEAVHGPWYHAIQRCLDACDDITSVIRNVADADLENASPHLIFCIFAAARFYIVHAKTLGVEIPRNLDLLTYSLRTFSQRWQMAFRLEKVVRTGVSEHKVPQGMTSLPAQFYDLQYSSLDIDDALRRWAESRQPWLHVYDQGQGGDSGAQNVAQLQTVDAALSATGHAIAAPTDVSPGHLGSDSLSLLSPNVDLSVGLASAQAMVA